MPLKMFEDYGFDNYTYLKLFIFMILCNFWHKDKEIIVINFYQFNELVER